MIKGQGRTKKNERSGWCWCIPLISIEKSSRDGAEQMLTIPDNREIVWFFFNSNTEFIVRGKKWVQVKVSDWMLNICNNVCADCHFSRLCSSQSLCSVNWCEKTAGAAHRICLHAALFSLELRPFWAKEKQKKETIEREREADREWHFRIFAASRKSLEIKFLCARFLNERSRREHWSIDSNGQWRIEKMAAQLFTLRPRMCGRMC